jgi:hypothetical protein
VATWSHECKYQPHVMVLPEDEANSQLATGFQLRLDPARLRQMQVLPVAGGWIEVLDRFESDHVAEMGHNSNRLMVLLVDFDGNAGRLDQAKRRIPGHLTERVFILGALSEPEELKARLGTYEAIGSALAQDCREETDTIWGHAPLRHNASELARLNEHVRPILFPPN